MKLILHGLSRLGALTIMGSANLDAHNALEIEFREGMLEAFVAGAFFPFLLVAPSSLTAWPAMPADLLSHRPVTQLWARGRGKETARRDLVWQGWPLLATWVIAVQDYGEPLPDAVVSFIRPLVPLPKLLDYERAASGFLCGFKEGPKREPEPPPAVPPSSPSLEVPAVRGLPLVDDDYTDAEVRAAHAPGAYTQAMTESFSAAQAEIQAAVAESCGRCPPGCGLGCDGAMHCADHCEPDAAPEAPSSPPLKVPAAAANTSAGVPGAPRRRHKESPQLGLFSAAAAPEPAPAAPSRACQVCGGPVAEGEDGCAPHAHAGGVSRVPAHVVRAHGPSPGRVRVRALGTCGLRFVRYGLEFEGDRCPARPDGVWIAAPKGDVSEGCSFRLIQGEWEDAAIPEPRP